MTRRSIWVCMIYWKRPWAHVSNGGEHSQITFDNVKLPWYNICSDKKSIAHFKIKNIEQESRELGLERLVFRSRQTVLEGDVHLTYIVMVYIHLLGHRTHHDNIIWILDSISLLQNGHSMRASTVFFAKRSQWGFKCAVIFLVNNFLLLRALKNAKVVVTWTSLS